jgi:hypothetical protein
MRQLLLHGVLGSIMRPIFCHTQTHCHVSRIKIPSLQQQTGVETRMQGGFAAAGWWPQQCPAIAVGEHPLIKGEVPGSLEICYGPLLTAFGCIGLLRS